MKLLDKLNQGLLKLMLVVGGIFLLAMVVLTCYNISMRPFKLGISGVYEVMGYFGAMVIASGLAYTQSRKAHLQVNLVVNSYPKPVQTAIGIINHAACLFLAVIAAWQVGVKGWIFYSTGEVSETLKWHYYFFTFGAAAGFGVLALVFFADLLKDLSGKREGKE
jgi:TRAP-type C4-dicarboxylate transport system permease small subunit